MRFPTFSCLAIRPCKYPWCRVKVLIHSNTSQSNLTRLAKWPFLSTKIWCATCLLLVEPLTPKMVNLHITFEQTNCFDLRCCVLSFFVVHDAFLETHTEGEKRMPKMEYHWYKGFFLKSWCSKEGVKAYPPILFAHWEMSARDYDTIPGQMEESPTENPEIWEGIPWYYLPSGMTSSHVTIIWVRKYPTLWHIVFLLCLSHVSRFRSRK